MRRACYKHLPDHLESIGQSNNLYQAIIDQKECDNVLAEQPYRSRLDANFESLGCVFNEGDNQEIETLCFDALDQDKTLAEDLWLKVSWLSFHEEDASIRFRFSFGVDHEEDVAADKSRQYHAAALTEAVFPESQLITDNYELLQTLSKILKCDEVNFVERIVYFNAPGGGAYLHHDRERGHAGVVYAQVSGSTFWLALPKRDLMKEISEFVAQCEGNTYWPLSIDDELKRELIKLCSEPDRLSQALESFCHTGLIHLINETKAFIEQLTSNGHGRLINAGDMILLPQESDMQCCWHTVFCTDEIPGQALSFAIRAGEPC